MNQPQELKALVREFAGRVREGRLRVAVAGDMILDNTIEGVPVGRHPEIGIPYLREGASHESIGGAANMALALSRLGVDVYLFGFVGSDLPGRQLLNLIERQSFDSYVSTITGWPTPRKDWIYHRENGQPIAQLRIDHDRPPPPRARQELMGEFRAHCPQRVDVVILADHGLGSFGAESIPIIPEARQRKAKVVAIPRTRVLLGQPVDAVVINSMEMRSYQEGSDGKPRELAERYARDHAQHVFLTLLEEGIYVCPADSKSGTLCGGYELQAGHWMGARDMATAIIALGLALELNPLDTAALATAFRHLVARQLGNGRVTWRDVFRFVGLDDA